MKNRRKRPMIRSKPTAKRCVASEIMKQSRKAARDMRAILKEMGLAPVPAVEGGWYRLKDTVDGVDEEARIVVAYCDQDHGGDTGIEITTYFCIAEGDYDHYDDARWIPVPQMPWEKECWDAD